MSADRVLAFAAAAERPSEHPLAAAVVIAAEQAGVTIATAREFSSTPGRGVSVTVDGYAVQVGSPALLAQHDAATARSAAEAIVAELEALGGTAVVVVIDGTVVGVLGLIDRVRTDAHAAVRQLTATTIYPPILLTGDNARAAHRLAADVGIDEVHAGLLPADKVTQVHAMQSAGRHVLLVGDGVNDAPALATAHLGVAMGAHGSDLALETADAVIIRDELSTLAAVIDLSRRARRTVTANLIIAATVITGLVIWDLVGHLPLPLGVAGHEGSTVIVGLNGLRLLRASAWRATRMPAPAE
jgi:cation-transporting P-type ATPase J